MFKSTKNIGFCIGKINDSNIDDSLRKKLCLDDEKLLLLCSIGIFVEHQYDSPRDIEWAISGVSNHNILFGFVGIN